MSVICSCWRDLWRRLKKPSIPVLLKSKDKFAIPAQPQHLFDIRERGFLLSLKEKIEQPAAVRKERERM